MKKGAFLRLLYREWALVRKPLVIMLISSLSMIVPVFLVMLSFRYGNLSLLDENLKAVIFGDFAFAVKVLPGFSFCFIVSAPAEAARFELKTVWERFRRSTPVSCQRFALAKYTIMTALTLVAAGGAIGATALTCAAMGTAFTASDAALAMALLAVAVIFSVVMQVAVIFFKSSDKGGLAAAGVIFACLFSVIAANRDAISKKVADLTSIEQLNIFIEKLGDVVLPFIPLVIVASLALGLFATTMIYKRREK